MAVDVAPKAGRIPTEITAYWDALEKPKVKRARAAARRLLRFDPLPSEETARGYAEGFYEADPVAEAFVDEVYLGRSPNEGRKMLDLALRDGVDAVPDAPDSMRRLFAESERDPDWLDPERVEIGAKVFRRLGPSAFSFAGASTLISYTESTIVKPLALTGTYAGDSALNRFMETARFWIETTEPGGLKPGGLGRATAMRVRIMHVFIRRRLLQHPEWDFEAWGMPISQSDMVIPLLSSSLMTGFGLKTMGHRTSMREIDAMIHLWRYIGHIMGAQSPHYPETIREGIQISAMWMLKFTEQAVDDGRELIESYPRAFTPQAGTPWRKRVRDEVNYRAQLGYTRFFLPPWFYRKYDMPQPWPWALHPLAQFPLNFVASTLARRIGPVGEAVERFQRWRRQSWWRNEMGDRQAAFKAAESFRR